VRPVVSANLIRAALAEIELLILNFWNNATTATFSRATVVPLLAKLKHVETIMLTLEKSATTEIKTPTMGAALIASVLNSAATYSLTKQKPATTGTKTPTTGAAPIALGKNSAAMDSSTKAKSATTGTMFLATAATHLAPKKKFVVMD
jgi:hypothetical protein